MIGFENTIDLTFDDELIDFLSYYSNNNLKFIWLEDNLWLEGRQIELSEDNISSEIEHLTEFLKENKIFDGKYEVLYDCFCYKLEKLNRIETNELYIVDNRIVFDISIYNYPDLIKDENDDIIWDSSKRDFKYKNIIDEIRKARKKYQMKKGCSN
ncbi:hypothetical protein [Leptotrichia sp. oral taxon 212]|jgi:hypothetical protein|uniref:hypothetical protein n=1 Tax=Leptotrichia sp. oral taxon 212 TaxID=712357 RepID=UPI0006A9B900|nr:hypothetical protein [Leptotrichia sp. oral taxon 212]ALA96275.1 hypothetical protein AMK43_09935 [Leptotrichia sp. oral taxon 212]DAN40306.1 MAG TPA: hypothetical protein [Caudoviricetes sp.]